MNAIGAIGGQPSSMQMLVKCPSASEFSDKILKYNDKDGNRSLSLAESRLDQTSFSKLDTNSDGQIDSEELQTKIENDLKLGPPKTGGQHRSPEEMAKEIMRQIDLDHTGTLSSKEIGDTRAFRLLDADQNGTVNLQEITTAIDPQKAQSTQQADPDQPDYVAKAGQGQGTLGMSSLGLINIGKFMSMSEDSPHELSMLNVLKTKIHSEDPSTEKTEKQEQTDAQKDQAQTIQAQTEATTTQADSEQLQAKIQQAQADIDQAQIKLEKAQAKAKTPQTGDQQTQVGSQQAQADIEQAKTEIEQAKANVKQAQQTNVKTNQTQAENQTPQTLDSKKLLEGWKQIKLNS